METARSSRRCFLRTASAAALAPFGIGPSTRSGAGGGRRRWPHEDHQGRGGAVPRGTCASRASRPTGSGCGCIPTQGLVGIGETYPGYDAHAGALKEIAGMLLGRDPTHIERLWQDIFYRISYQPLGRRRVPHPHRHQHRPVGHARQGGRACPVYKLLGGKAQRRSCSSTTP